MWDNRAVRELVKDEGLKAFMTHRA
jgi:hypothetical protein